ncbi:MAG: cell division protein FtsQ/DivIB [Candidatus Gracilibacteria bacterium]|jgi:cell division septal protein FtsQ
MFFFKKKKTGQTLTPMGRYRPSIQISSRRQAVKPLKNFIQNPEKKIFKARSTERNFKKFIRPLVLIGIGIILYGIAYLLFISDTFTITKIELKIEGADSTIVEDENPIVLYLKNFEETNILIFNDFEEETYLKQVYPEYKSIEIKKSLPHTLVLKLEPYMVSANLIAEKDSISKKFLINENGTIVAENEEDPSLPYIYIETTEVIIKGQTAIKPENLAFIIEATEDFQNKFGMQILDITYYKMEREVHLRTEKYFVVWLDIQLTVDEQLNKLKQALPELNIYETPLEYIDLRISGQNGDKVIYMEK